MKPIISIIIVNYNAGEQLRRCVNALLASRTTRDLNIALVDNASTDGSLDAVLESSGQRTRNTQVSLIRNFTNRGFAAACNQGVQQSRGSHLLFLNPDCIVEPDAIEEALHALEANTQAGMAGGLIMNPDGTEQRGCRRQIPSPKQSLTHLIGLSRLFPERFSDFNAAGTPIPESPTTVEAISGAFMLVKRQAVDVVGPWDEGYFLHIEDVDWCQRFQAHGYVILFVPTARAIHYQGTCSRGRMVRVEWHKHRGMWRFYSKSQSADHSVWFKSLVATGISLSFLMRASILAMRRIARLERGRPYSVGEITRDQ